MKNVSKFLLEKFQDADIESAMKDRFKNLDYSGFVDALTIVDIVQNNVTKPEKGQDISTEEIQQSFVDNFYPGYSVLKKLTVQDIAHVSNLLDYVSKCHASTSTEVASIASFLSKSHFESPNIEFAEDFMTFAYALTKMVEAQGILESVFMGQKDSEEEVEISPEEIEDVLNGMPSAMRSEGL